MISDTSNWHALDQELDWLEAVIAQVIAAYLQHEGHEDAGPTQAAPALDDSAYARQVAAWELDDQERLTLALALAPHLRPQALDIFFGVNGRIERGFSEFGGVTDAAFSGFLPTGQTLVFLLGANSPAGRVRALEILAAQHRYAVEQVIGLERSQERMPALSGVLSLSEQWLQFFLTGQRVRPELSASFPASPITTPHEWPDLVLDHQVMAQVAEIRAWIDHGATLMQDWGLGKKVKPGYRAVFHGPPGTGKTLTAALLGKATGRAVYRVDLSMIVSKYIGETEKNLGKVFDIASHKAWILFFDEADALFGKRTAATSSNDRHANQQTGYLLQRIEDFPGTVILSTNLKANMDDAFTRRFQTMIQFTMPNAANREQLWRKAFAGVGELDADIDLAQIGRDYEMAGGAIINVLRHCALAAIRQGHRRITRDSLIEGIRREFRKDNRTLQADRGAH